MNRFFVLLIILEFDFVAQNFFSLLYVLQIIPIIFFRQEKKAKCIIPL